MSDPRGFLTHERELPALRPPDERVRDFKDVHQADFPLEKTQIQASRCMDCGVPFCHQGCPLGNVVPEFNEAVQAGDWRQAVEILASTNNFPEFTGRICPAPCEAACVLGINQPPVAIEHIEQRIAEEGFERGYIRPQPPTWRTGRRVAIVGSGPAGLAAAEQLNRAGHHVTVFERQDRPGGLLRYGIPDFKLEKWVLERRLALMEAEGIRFRTHCEVGRDVPAEAILRDFDAVLLCTGASVPRDLPIEGRHLAGVHWAMDYLEQANRRVAGDPLPGTGSLSAAGQHVVVIGGGDTGADCVGTARRQGAASVTQLSIHAMPPLQRGPNEWPNWPFVLRTSSSHEEGCVREWAVQTQAFVADGAGRLRALRIVEVEWAAEPATGRHAMRERPGTARELPCGLALLAIGFVQPEQALLQAFGLARDGRGQVLGQAYRSSVPKVFVAGDLRRGQSLVVWAIAEGRGAAAAIGQFLAEGPPPHQP